MLHYESGLARQYRRNLRLTADEIAKRAEISVRGLRAIEAGAIPKADTLARIASALGLKVGAFFVEVTR